MGIDTLLLRSANGFMTILLTAALLLAAVEPIPSGSATIEVAAGAAPLEVFTYKPANYRDGPLILVFHGVLRNAAEYRDDARAMGDRFGALIAAPLFDLERFPVSAYQQGNIRRDGKTVPPEEWSGRLIAPIVAELRSREGRPEMPYYLIGHSGGGQFLVRMAGFVETEASRIVAANPGTHLVATRKAPFPYGFGGLPPDLSGDLALRRYLAQPLTIYLGAGDTEADEHLDDRPEALRQGPTRLARGRFAFETARGLAQRKGWAFHWRLVEARGVGHDHEQMFNHPNCRQALFGLAPASVVAHRGFAREAPENTLAAFRACLDMRIGFECDVRQAADGTLVCLHDETLDRTTSGHGQLAEFSLADVRRLDAGQWFSRQFTGERVPTFAETLGLLAECPDKSLLVAIDIKTSAAEAEREMVRQASDRGLLDQLVFIGSAIESALVRRRLKEANARARTARLVTDAAAISAAIDDRDCDWVYVRFIPAADDVRRIQLAGKRVFLAGPLVAGNEQKHWQSAGAAAIDAILTDYPLSLRRTLAGDTVQSRW